MWRPGGTFDTSYRETLAIFRTRFHKFMLLLLFILLLTTPLYASQYFLSVLSVAFIIIIAVHGLNILTGYTGQISLGQVGFMAVGAYVSGILGARFGLPFWASLPCAAFSTGVVGLIFGLPSLRLKGFYLAMATLAAHFIILWIIIHAPEFSGGVDGLIIPRLQIAGLGMTERSLYYVNLIFVAGMTYFARNLARTRLGRSFVAIRDNDLAAEVMGIDVFRYKLTAFFISAVFAGVAGSLWANYLGLITPEQFPLMDAIWFLGMIIVGGMGSVLGTIFGVVLLKGLSEVVILLGPMLGSIAPALGGRVAAAMAQIFFGVVIIVFLIFEPRGLAHRWGLLKTSFRMWPFSY